MIILQRALSVPKQKTTSFFQAQQASHTTNYKPTRIEAQPPLLNLNPGRHEKQETGDLKLQKLRHLAITHRPLKTRISKHFASANSLSVT